MSGGDGKLAGPDLTEGVDAQSLRDGATLVGHAHGEAVLLARQGREVFAVGAACSHYGGPLGEGLVVGDTVRCPLHHACFSMRTGEPTRAPALSPIASFAVEERAGRLYVLGRRAAPAKATPPSRPSSIVIVGAGAAGNAAAETLRREGYEGDVTILGADEFAPYDRPNLSKDYLAGTASEEWIPLRTSQFYDDERIAVRVAARVRRIDVVEHRVELEDGTKLPYSALLLATGAAPVHLKVPGAELGHVCYLRTLADSRAIIERAKSAKRAVIVGASFIGLEVAASLRARGLDVHVVAPDERPLGRIMGPAMGDFIKALHEEHGVVFHLRETIKSIDDKGVTLESGVSLDGDLVVAGIGVRPSLELAEGAGLSMDRGVLVNQYLQTSAPDVWGAGDIARWPDPHSGQRIRVEHWVVAERHGQIAARNMLGHRVPCDLVPFFWSQHYDVTLSYVGHAEQWDRIDVSGDLRRRDATVAFRLGGKTVAVVTVGRDRESLAAERAFEVSDAKALEALGR
jgi:NADPH-dependent 2,4-dienoyl-CoA reductase/sulfur reductase-like enzyme/nitrite reductase/ring-hydroxylating ferredoxin subunit